jgi:hypothetical protein
VQQVDLAGIPGFLGGFENVTPNSIAWAVGIHYNARPLQAGVAQ